MADGSTPPRRATHRHGAERCGRPRSQRRPRRHARTRGRADEPRETRGDTCATRGRSRARQRSDDRRDAPALCCRWAEIAWGLWASCRRSCRWRRRRGDFSLRADPSCNQGEKPMRYAACSARYTGCSAARSADVRTAGPGIEPRRKRHAILLLDARGSWHPSNSRPCDFRIRLVQLHPDKPEPLFRRRLAGRTASAKRVQDDSPRRGHKPAKVSHQ